MPNSPSQIDLSPQSLLTAYANAYFPMADDNGNLGWYTADPRGILPLQNLHIPRSLRRTLRQNHFQITIDNAFEKVIAACAQPRGQDNEPSWITPPIIDAYTQLHQLGFAHSIEAWQHPQDDPNHPPTLVGGIYGVSLGSAFFGESMFHRASDASKVCLVHLAQHLNNRHFTLFDTQMTTPVVAALGGTHIPAKNYLEKLHYAVQQPAHW